MRFILAILVTSLFVLSCTDERLSPDEVDTGLSFFPLEQGRSWTYAVDSIVYDFSGSGTAVDSTRSYFQLQLTEVDELAEETVAVVERFWRAKGQDPWQIHAVLQMSRDDEGAYWTEDNLRFVKIQWPASDNQSWDGHRFFDSNSGFSVAGESIQLFKNWDYRVLDRDANLEILGASFTDVLAVQEAEDENLIEFRSAKSFYAKDVGLVFKEWQLLDTQCETCCDLDFGLCTDLPWREKAEVGFILREQLIDFE